jgi:hypothetical protein
VNNGIISNIAGGKYGPTCDQSLNLNFMLGRRKDHEDIQINIKGLVRFLSSLPLLKSNTWSIINIKLYEKQGPYRTKVELPIKKQRKAVFLFFTDFPLSEESQYTTPLYIPPTSGSTATAISSNASISQESSVVQERPASNSIWIEMVVTFSRRIKNRSLLSWLTESGGVLRQ